MKKLTAGILTVMLGLVAADANAAVTSKKYVDDALKATNTALTETINTTKTELTGRIETVEGDVDTIEGNISNINTTLENITGNGADGIANKIATAVKTETDRATAAEKTLTDNLAAEVTRADTAEKKIAKDLSDYQTSNNAALANKADKSDTYTKEEVDDKDAAVDAHIGTLTTLTTNKKGSAVEAINELDTGVKANAAEITNIKAGTALADGAVTEAKIAAGAVTTDKIANTAVTADKIATDAVTTGKIENGAVTADKIGTGAVTTDKIADVAGLTAMDGATKVSVNAKGQITKAEKAVLQDLTNVPTACTQAGAECVLKYNPTSKGFAWEDIADTYTPAQQPDA